MLFSSKIEYFCRWRELVTPDSRHNYEIREISMANHSCLFDHCSVTDELRICYSMILMSIHSFLSSEGREADHRQPWHFQTSPGSSPGLKPVPGFPALESENVLSLRYN